MEEPKDSFVALAEESGVKNSYPPLFLPVGSIRAILVIIVTGITGYMVLNQLMIPEWWTLFFTASVAYYFKSRPE